jgi:hypothetical protein
MLTSDLHRLAFGRLGSDKGEVPGSIPGAPIRFKSKAEHVLVYLSAVGSAARNPSTKCVVYTLLKGIAAVSRPSRVPSYHLHKPSGQAIIVIRGKTIYLGRHGSLESKAEYNRALAEWLAQGAGGPLSGAGASSGSEPGADLTVSELISEYWAFAKDSSTTASPVPRSDSL